MVVSDRFSCCVYPVLWSSRARYRYSYPLFPRLWCDLPLLVVGLFIQPALSYVLVGIALGVMPEDTVALLVI